MLFRDSLIKYIFIDHAEYLPVSPIDILTNSITFKCDRGCAQHRELSEKQRTPTSKLGTRLTFDRHRLTVLLVKSSRLNRYDVHTVHTVKNSLGIETVSPI